uniref:Ankyrin repeat-containing protein n=1 Tax=Borely moumouvirus TaxID=2712067 RepID=A0A6G6AAB5_9VIRU
MINNMEAMNSHTFCKIFPTNQYSDLTDKPIDELPLTFTNVENIFTYLDHGIYFSVVNIPDNANIIKDNISPKWTTNHFTIGQFVNLKNLQAIKHLIESGAKINRPICTKIYYWALQNNCEDIANFFLSNYLTNVFLRSVSHDEE